MSRLLLTAAVIISLFSFCNKTKAPKIPEGKGIDYVSVAKLSTAEMRSLKTNLNDKHNIEAHKSDLKEPIKDKTYFNDNKESICKKADLTKIETNELYVVARLTHSLPYVNDKTADFLDLLGKRMQESFKEKDIRPYRFTLTSVLRTLKDQRHLQKVNVNATPNETPHYFGTTFDISQTRFQMTDSNEPLYNYRLRNLLARELIKLQDEGKCYVILESREKCFHVTVRQ